MIIQDLVRTEARRAGKGEEQFLKEAVEGLDEPDEAQLRQVYEENRQAFGERTFEDIKPFLLANLRRAAVADYLEGLKAKAGVRMMLPQPRLEVSAIGPSKGPESAPVTIVEFSDFECPFCAKGAATAKQLVEANHGNVRLVFRDLPLQMHEHAQEAAEAGQCADEQGRFWDMHDYMFSNQAKLSPADLKTAARQLGLDGPKFEECLDTGKYAGKVGENVEAAEELGIASTPSFLINGRLIAGAQPIDVFQRAIDEELSQLQ